MPRPRRLLRSRVAGDLPAVCWRYLADLLEPGDRETEEFIAFEFFHEPMPIDEAWRRFGKQATAMHARQHPGHRPSLWWQHSAPRTPAGEPHKRPSCESEAAFLERHGLLLPLERPPAAAFEPEAGPA